MKDYVSKIILGVLIPSFILVGCSGRTPGTDKKMGSVKFTITYDGGPVTEGSVQITAGGGKAAGGKLNSTGELFLSDVEVGDYVVCITPPSAKPNPEGGAPIMPENPNNIPNNFHSSSTSPLKAKVNEGTNEFTFELKE